MLYYYKYIGVFIICTNWFKINIIVIKWDFRHSWPSSCPCRWWGAAWRPRATGATPRRCWWRSSRGLRAAKPAAIEEIWLLVIGVGFSAYLKVVQVVKNGHAANPEHGLLHLLATIHGLVIAEKVVPSASLNWLPIRVHQATGLWQAVHFSRPPPNLE